MKKTFFILLAMLALAFSVIAQRDLRGEAMERKASIDEAMKRVQVLPSNRIAEYSARMEAAKAKGAQQSAPAMLFASFGNTFTGLTVYAYNAKDLPDGTVVAAVKTVGGNVQVLNWTYMAGGVPASFFRYPLEDAKRGQWTEPFGDILYEIYTFFPDTTTSYSYVVKPINKYWSTMVTTEKLIDTGMAKFIGNQPIMWLQGSITRTNGPVSVMIKDPDVDYDQRAVPFSINSGNLKVYLSSWGQEVVPGSELMVLVGTADGRTDQYFVRVQ